MLLLLAVIVEVPWVPPPPPRPYPHPRVHRRDGVDGGGPCPVQREQEPRDDAERPQRGDDEEGQAADEAGLVAPQEGGQLEQEDEDGGHHPCGAIISTLLSFSQKWHVYRIDRKHVIRRTGEGGGGSHLSLTLHQLVQLWTIMLWAGVPGRV